jgi:hypothetical protein
VLIVVNDVETAIGEGEARRLSRELRAGARKRTGPIARSAAALVVAEAISRGMRDPRMSRLIVRERGALDALAATLEARSTALSEAEAQLLRALRGG